MLRKTFLTAFVFLFSMSLVAMAGDKPIARSFRGTLSCMGCDLKKSDGAHAQCKTLGHKHALKLADGSFISFLENDHSTDLIKGGEWHNQEVEVDGIYYGNANVVDVEFYKIKHDTFGWCESHETMDKCASSKRVLKMKETGK